MDLMSLIHYTSEPLDFDWTRTYEQDPPNAFGKPKGLWVSVRGRDDWPSWCRQEEFGLSGLSHAHMVGVHPDAKVLILNCPADLRNFHRAFSVETDWEFRMALKGIGVRADWPIDWRKVASMFDGIVIAPYQWSMRMNSWYYGWDCASGCIWNLDAIYSIASLEEVA